MRYLVGTTTYGIVFAPGDGVWRLHGSADADLGGDLSTAKSTSGSVTQLGEYGNISCRSHLKKKNSTSTLQAETYSYVDLCKEIAWDRDWMHELGFPQEGATEARCDNSGVIIQSTKQVNHGVAKHFRLSQGYVRYMCGEDVVDPTDVDSEDNESDMLTKPLPKPSFVKHRLTIMGPQERPSSQ